MWLDEVTTKIEKNGHTPLSFERFFAFVHKVFLICVLEGWFGKSKRSGVFGNFNHRRSGFSA